jgi:hypothetical protein
MLFRRPVNYDHTAACMARQQAADAQLAASQAN